VTVRAALLQLLDEAESHGYQLKVDFESRTGGIWPLNVGQVYTTLDRLVRDGCVVPVGAEGQESQRLYRITEDGRREVKEWLMASPSDQNPSRDPLVMKVLVAVGAAPPAALSTIDQQRSALMAQLQTARRRQPKGSAITTAQRLARDSLMRRMEADLSWLDHCEEAVRHMSTRRKP
jgi:DNA-binding PadR family transcriptional regulator